jgi:hypothetical protein
MPHFAVLFLASRDRQEAVTNTNCFALHPFGANAFQLPFLGMIAGS